MEELKERLICILLHFEKYKVKGRSYIMWRGFYGETFQLSSRVEDSAQIDQVLSLFNVSVTSKYMEPSLVSIWERRDCLFRPSPSSEPRVCDVNLITLVGAHYHQRRNFSNYFWAILRTIFR